MSRFRSSPPRLKSAVITQPAPSRAPAGIAPPAAATLAPAEPPRSSIARGPVAKERIGLLTTLLGVYIFMHVAPVAEILFSYFNNKIPVVIIAGILVSLGALYTGRLGRFWPAWIAKPWMLLIALLLAASALGDYPGLSVPLMLQYAIRFHIIPFLICAIAVTATAVKRLMYWAAAACILVLIFCAIFGQIGQGRLFIPRTSLGNPNDLAFVLLFGGTFLLALLYGKSRIGSLIALVALPLTLVYVLATGSRANFVTILVVALVYFVVAPRATKGALLVFFPVILVVMYLVIPAETWQRLTLILVNPTEEFRRNGEDRGAIGSQIARTQLQERAIALTLRHPLFGVGPQMFENAVEEMVREDTGTKSGWQNAHNVYLQIAAENGIPALILYLWSIILCLKMNYRSYRMCRKHPDQMQNEAQSLSLFLTTIAYAIGTLFNNFTYSAFLPLVVGLSTANYLAIQEAVPIERRAHPQAG